MKNPDLGMDNPAQGLPSALHIVVAGKVRRVGFRRFAKQSADRLGLTGWVRNRRQGEVEIQAVGEKRLLEAFLARIREGPKSAIIQEISVHWLEADQPYRHFRIRWFG